MFSCTVAEPTGSAVGRVCLCHRPEIQTLTRRIGSQLSRRGFVAGAGASIAALGVPRRAKAETASEPTRPIVLTNFRLFDGRSPTLREGRRLVIDDGRVSAVVTGDAGAPEGARVIDCSGRVVMPGLIDAHWHSVFAALPISSLFAADVGYIFLAASGEAERTLMRGFTTIRDLGGPSFPLKQAIDEGLVQGPRIYPCGAMITTSGGHGDLRPLQDIPRSPGGPLSSMEETGGAMIADSADEVRLRVREQLLQGASQIKLVGGGGVSSPRTALDMTTFSEPELRAGIETARDWNTYVAVHAYAPQTVQRAIASGAQCIEHAHLMDEATAKLMAEKDVWLSIQPFLSDADTGVLTGQSRINQLQVFAGADTAYGLAKAHNIKTAFGSDLLFSSQLASRQGLMLTHLTRWYGAAEILTMATATNGELLALSGPRNPYPGKLGVIEKGAHADLLVVDGDPLQDIALLA
ncbi:MAG TPA: amidohydrolase family protein, partial [Acetobacteraceae bacterium]|nr:amidohydrolase family protein [Acetobacteraceae bacterium]